MGDIELKHSAKGSTWQKKGASYISRVKKNGKWVYTYASNKAKQAGKTVAEAADKVGDTAKSAMASSKVNPDVLSTRIRKKTRKNIAKGQARVNEILKKLNRQRRLTTSKVKGKVKRKIKNIRSGEIYSRGHN